ncbi:hypothetical protein KP509_34G042900 [Ceratopteris richardii]|nr:hypothetical protein KP509_34G042900 [Ceratopteris richardii]
MVKLCSNDVEEKREAARSFRNLAKSSSSNRLCIGQIGAIPRLIALLYSPDTQTQTHSVTALFNLTLRNEQNKDAIACDKGIDAIVQVLINGEIEARENSAALLCNLARSEAYHEVLCGEDLFIGLVGVLRDGSQRGKRDAAAAMYTLLRNRRNRVSAVRAGAVNALLDIAGNGETGLVDESLAVLVNLAGYRDGRREIQSPYGLQCLLDLIKHGSDSNKEFASALLLLLCQHSLSALSALRALCAREPFVALSIRGTDRACRKATKMLELLSSV